jgi:transcription initiation factor IIE alpha subunit
MPVTTPRNKDLSFRIVQELTVTGGLTTDELAKALGVDVRLIRPRVSTLKQAKKIYATEERRKNAKGRSPRVLAVVTKPRGDA